MCKYCERESYEEKYIYDDRKWSRKTHSDFGIRVYIENNKLNIGASADTYEPGYVECEIDINYCPMCGKNLKEE